VFAVAKTFWPKRSVALPTVVPAPAPASSLTDEISRLRAEVELLQERISTLESAEAADEAPPARELRRR
jgi:hypothetical protein